MNRSSTVVLWLFTFMSAALAQAQHPAMPPGTRHEEHPAKDQKAAELKARGASVMGFDQDKTTHHFLLTRSGGIIQVDVKDHADSANRDAIRAHLKTIADAFTRGDFGKPSETHNEMPPGVTTMQELETSISYVFEQTPAGGSVRISTTDARALHAVHDFLRYQIREHATGDLLTVQR